MTLQVYGKCQFFLLSISVQKFGMEGKTIPFILGHSALGIFNTVRSLPFFTQCTCLDHLLSMRRTTAYTNIQTRAP